MVMLGWLIVTLAGAFFSFAGVMLFFVGGAFSGRLCYEALIPGAIGGLLLWWSYSSVPFTLTMVAQ